MNNENAFSYTYSAPKNQEVLDIRSKYLPRQESKLEELKRLDRLVQLSGTAESLCAGVGGCLVFGLGMCLGMEALGHIQWLGIVLGLAGIAGMAAAYPVHSRIFAKTKAQYAPRILQLTDELTGQEPTFDTH